MTVEFIGVVALMVGLFSVFLPSTFIIYAFACSTLLGAAAAFNLDSLGGLSISPAHLLLGFLTFRLLSEQEIRQKASEAIEIGRPGFWLISAVLVSLATAFIMPRLFLGQTFVFPVRAQVGGVAPLEPAMSNVTQSIYFIADATCFVVLSGFAATRGGMKVLLSVVLVNATTNLVFAAVDLLTYFTNTTIIMSVIRNANYNMLAETELAGFKRIVGSFVEASSFGATTLGYFAFTLRLWLLGLYPRLTFALASLSLLAALFATSTTAYVGLASFLAFSYLQVVVRGMLRPLTPQMWIFIVGAPLLLSIAAIAISLSDPYAEYVQNLLDTFLFNKMSSASGEERSAWNRQALQSFFDTFGFGVGNGSARASSFPIAALASLGLFGAMIFAGFFATLLLGRRPNYPIDPVDDATNQAGKSMCLAWLISGTISAPMIDLGPAFYAFAAIAGAQLLPSNRQFSALLPPRRPPLRSTVNPRLAPGAPESP